MLPAYGALHHQHALIWNFVLYSLPASQRGVYSCVCVCVRVIERDSLHVGLSVCVCVCVFVHLGVVWALKQEQRGKVLSDVCNV